MDAAARVMTSLADEQLEELTDRQREITTLVARGLDNADIAMVLTLSPATVRTHVSRCMAKLRCRTRAQLVVYAYETGLVRAGHERAAG